MMGILRCERKKLLNLLCIVYIKDNNLSLKIAYILANSADPDEMPPYAAFHPGLQCLPNYLFTGIQNENGKTYLFSYLVKLDS